MRNWKSVGLVLLLVAAANLRAAENAALPPSISTTGEATVYVTPDEVIINFGVETFKPALADAKTQNDAQTKTLLAAIRDLGVEDKYIQTDVMQVQIDYPNGGAKNGIDGYVCRRQYTVTLKDTSKFESLIDAGLNNGANYLMGVEFRTTELRKHRDEARKLAIHAAKEKAVALATELEMKVELPRTIGEGSIGFWGYTSNWWGWSGYGNQYISQNAVQQAPGGGSGSGDETMPLGQIAIRASVAVTFEMSPAH